MSDKKKTNLKNILQNTAIIAGGILILILILWVSNAFKPLENLTLDNRYTSRYFQKPQISDEILNIIIDDGAIENVGRWPWSWDKLKIIIEAADYYAAKSCAFVDINFNKESNVNLSEQGAAILQTNINNYIINDYDTMTILGSVENRNKEMLAAIKKYPHIFLCSNLYIPEIFLSDDELIKLTELKKKDILADRMLNIESMSKFILKNVKNSEQLIRAIDFIPPLKQLNYEVNGVGYNRIFADEDGIVRNYSMAVNYDNKVYPSLITSMAANYYNCPADKIYIIPGKHIELQTGDSVIALPDNKQINVKYPIKIPIDKKGMMRINWTGAYKDTFKHIPYDLIAHHYSFIIAKKFLENYKDAELGAIDLNNIYAGLIQELTKAGIVGSDKAENISILMFSAWIMEYFLTHGASYENFLEQMGAEDDNSLKKMWTQIQHNNLLFDKLVETEKLPERADLFKEINIDINDTNYQLLLSEGYNQTVFFYLRGMINRMRPLYFPEPSELKIGLRIENISLLELSNKIIFTGLTATGLASFNPTPFENRYMMLGLPPNVLNTIITGQFLKDANLVLIIVILAIIIILITFITLKSSLYGSFTAFLLLLLYPVTAWYLFDKGIIIPVVNFLTAIVLSWLASISYKFIEVQRERKKLKNMFSTMVAPEVLKIIEDNPDKFNLSGELREATMFSSDVSGFTTISEGVTAQELANILNIYLTPMSNIVMKYNGYIDKYEGDAIKADFGVLPIQSSNEWQLDTEHSWKCSYSSLEQQEELSVIQRMIQLKFGVKISARMGVNTGVVSAGNMGSEKKRQFSVMGAAVTLAEELEPINKIFETWIAIGPSTYEKSKDYLETRLLNYLITHEDQPLLPVYELLGWKEEKFLEYWTGKPVPPLILDGLRKMPPEKILGYHHYYTFKKLPDTDFINQVKQRFSKLAPIAINSMKTLDILNMHNLKTELTLLNKRFDDLYSADETAAAENKKEIIKLKEKLSSSSKNWEKQILEWKIQTMRMTNLLLYSEKKIDYKLSEDLYKIVDTLEKRVECLNKRCQFTPADDAIASELGNNLQTLVESVYSTETNPVEIETQLDKISAELTTGLNELTDYMAANADEYHKMIAAYCRVSETKRKTVELFYKARDFYLKKDFEKAVEIFKNILTIDPLDGPANKYIAYIQKLKKDELAVDWNGAWHAE